MTLLKIDVPVSRISEQPHSDLGSKSAQAERHLADKNFGIPQCSVRQWVINRPSQGYLLLLVLFKYCEAYSDGHQAKEFCLYDFILNIFDLP